MSQYGFRDGIFNVKKLSVEDKIAVSYTVPYLTAVSSTGVLNGWDVSAGTASKIQKNFTAQPPYPMELSVQAVVAGGTSAAGVLSDGLVIVGYDAKGNKVREVVQVSSTGGTGAAAYQYSNNAFGRITSITPDSASHTSTDVNVGWRAVLGLPYPIASSGDIISYSIDNLAATTAPTIDSTYDNVTLASMSAGSTFSIVYNTKLQK